MSAAHHNLLWQRLLAALKDRDALPETIGNGTPLEIARFADERLRTDLAVSFVEGYYQERRYGGISSRLSEAEAEALVAQIEALPRVLPLQPATSIASQTQTSGPAPQTPMQSIPFTRASAPATAKPAPAMPEVEESQPIGIEFLPKPKPAPKPAPPPIAQRVEQTAKAAAPAKPKPKKPAKPRKVRRTFREWFGDTVKGCLTNLLFYGFCLLVAAPFLYWDHWRHTTHWKLETAGDATYITALSDIYGSTQKDPAREKLMIGCENGRDFVRFTWMQPMPSSSRPYLYQGIYLHHGLRVPYHDDPHATTIAWQDHLFLQPLQGESSASDFQAISTMPEREGETPSERDREKKELNVQSFLSGLSHADELVLDIEGYLDSQGKRWNYDSGNNDYSNDSDLEIRFGTDGLARHLPELQQACQWNPSQQ